MTADNDRRVLTDRLADASDQLDRIPDRQGGTPIMAGKVYDGGNLPSSAPAWYLTHPVDFDGTETEGQPFTPTVDTSASIPVLVIGHPPKVDDILIAEYVGGKWVSSGGHTETCGCFACADIPAADLDVTVSDRGDGVDMPDFTLQYGGSSGSFAAWSSDTDATEGVEFTLRCSRQLTAKYPDPFPDGTVYSASPSSESSNPFTLVFRDAFPGTSSEATYTVTGPPLGPNPIYCVRICVSGCICGPLAGASVTIADGDGKTVASGTTSGAGCVTLDIKKKGTYTVTVSAEGWVTLTRTMALTCTRIGIGLLKEGPFTLTWKNRINCPDGSAVMMPNPAHSLWTATIGSGGTEPGNCFCTDVIYDCGLNSELSFVTCDGIDSGALNPTSIDCDAKIIAYDAGIGVTYTVTW